jgi:hypothetical protein
VLSPGKDAGHEQPTASNLMSTDCIRRIPLLLIDNEMKEPLPLAVDERFRSSGFQRTRFHAGIAN